MLVAEFRPDNPETVVRMVNTSMGTGLPFQIHSTLCTGSSARHRGGNIAPMLCLLICPPCSQVKPTSISPAVGTLELRQALPSRNRCSKRVIYNVAPSNCPWYCLLASGTAGYAVFDVTW